MSSKFLKELNAKLPQSINALNKEICQKAVKDAQVFVNENQDILNQLNDEELKHFNAEIAVKNCRLVKNKAGTWDLVDRHLAYEAKGNYSMMFQDFLGSTNDKDKETEVVNLFMEKVLHRLYSKARGQEIKLIDLGCGDGQVGAKLLDKVKEFGPAEQKLKPAYIAVDRDARCGNWVQTTCAELKIPYTFHHADFREQILATLKKEQAQFVLASHLYTTTPMNKFLPMTFDMLGLNGISILIHEMESDAAFIAKRFKNLLKLTTKDYTQRIAESFGEVNVAGTITLDYESELKFPRIDEEEWADLYKIEQAYYDADYSYFSANLLKLKHLIEYTISDRLEAFSKEELHALLDFIKEGLEQKDYVLKSRSKIQVVLAPECTKEFRQQFLYLKKDIESNQALANSKFALFYTSGSKNLKEQEKSLDFSL